MSHRITIGNAVLRPDGHGHVPRVDLAEAPSFPGEWELNDRSNVRTPSYSWCRICEVMGVHDLFFDPLRGLMRELVSLVPLLPGHLEVVHRARLDWERTHPRTAPGFDEMPASAGTLTCDGVLAIHRAREAWMREHPGRRPTWDENSLVPAQPVAASHALIREGRRLTLQRRARGGRWVPVSNDPLSSLADVCGTEPPIRLLGATSGQVPDGFLARLIWLEWWIAWALDNCPLPAIHTE